MAQYKLVIFGSNWDVYQVAYRELIDNPHITYIPTYRPKGLLGQLQRLHVNPRLNHIASIPGKPLWNHYHLRKIKDRHICFLIPENWLKMECGFRLLPYLRKHYPQARIVCFTQDIIATIKDRYSQQPIDTEYIKRYSDLFISYDITDAKKHGLQYHPTIYSAIDFCKEDTPELYDLFFLGRDKGRLATLVNICKKARQHHLTCKFLLIEVPEKDRIACEGISYLDHQISYKENLRFCQQSRCIMEILQPDAASPTFRTWEALSLNKKLLTNGPFVKSSEFYHESYISVFHDETDIDWDFVKSPGKFSDQARGYQEKIRPESLIRFIEKELGIAIDR